MRAILFDFGGTLDFPRHWLDRFVTHYQLAGIEIGRKQLETPFSIATRKGYTCSAMLRHYSLSQLVGFLVDLQFEHLARDSGAAPAMLAQILANEGAKEQQTHIRDSFVAESENGLAASRCVLGLLAGRFEIAVVSNFYGNLQRVIGDADLARSISLISDSGVLGVYKPDPRIFAASLECLGVDAHEAVMVGDSISKDCAPAHAMGMTTVWLRHRECCQRRPSASDPVDFTIDKLEELEDLACLAG